jgi:prepilin-type processing-associated H-X9-DG protein
MGEWVKAGRAAAGLGGKQRGNVAFLDGQLKLVWDNGGRIVRASWRGVTSAEAEAASVASGQWTDGKWSCPYFGGGGSLNCKLFVINMLTF